MIGLFGATRGTTWRDSFVTRYTAENIPFFNPKKKGWRMEDAAIESEHMMVSDTVVLFAITDETHGFNPLAEIGWAATTVVASPTPRHLVVYIDPAVSQALHAEHEPSANGSVKCRGLVTSHLRKAAELYPSRIHIAASLQDMLEQSILLYKAT